MEKENIMNFDIEVFDSRNTSRTDSLVMRSWQTAKDYARKLSIENPFKIIVSNCDTGAWVQFEAGQLSEWSQLQ